MRHSLYWDDFEKRITETVQCLKTGKEIPVRRVAVFITDYCNLCCSYCNSKHSQHSMTQKIFEEIVAKYGNTAIIHITGGEPSMVPWLYLFLQATGDQYRFHLNTNAVIMPPIHSIKRLKVSLDSHNRDYWNELVGANVFDKVVNNIKKSTPHTVVSITYTLTRENYRQAIDFTRFAKREFPGIYAIFFSVYKGNNPRFVFEDADISVFFDEVMPTLKNILPEESLRLMEETLDEKRRLIKGDRFPQNNDNQPCYLSMSERVFDSDGNMSLCSHLYRDKIYHTTPEKHIKCCYGCNRRLVAFNEEVSLRMKT